MASTNTTNLSAGPSCVATAVTNFEAAAYDLLNAFNAASSHTQHVILNEFVCTSMLYEMPLTIGAATLARGVGAMNATAIAANSHAPGGCLRAAADHFDTAAHAFRQAVKDADQDTQHAIFQSYLSCDLPDIDSLGPLFAIAALGIAVNNMHKTDALGLTIEPWGDHHSGSPEHRPNTVATTKEQGTDMATASKAGLHLAYYESVQGLPLIVGPFPDYNTASRHIDGPNGDEKLYDRAWVQTLTTPDAGALYPSAKLPGQCHASGCDLPGTTHTEREKAETMLCDECAEHLD